MHGAGLGFARFDKTQRLRNRYLENQDLILFQRCFRNAVPGLDQRGISGALGGRRAADPLKELADRHRIGGVISTLIDHLEHILIANHAGSDLNAAGAPAVRHRHLASGKRHLIAGDRHCFKDGATDGAFGLLVEIAVVIAGEFSHGCAPDNRAGAVSAIPARPGNQRSAAA